MYPGYYAEKYPNRPAVIIAETGEQISFADLEYRSRQVAALFAASALEIGDRAAILIENRIEYFIVIWALWRSGLRTLSINSRIYADEAAWILDHSDARLVIASAPSAPLAEQLPPLASGVRHFYSLGGAITGFQPIEQAYSIKLPKSRPVEARGDFMFYSSGSTGKPKGVMWHAEPGTIEDGWSFAGWAKPLLGLNDSSRMLITAPLYHSGPAGWAFTAQVLGMTVVLMQKFDPGQVLSAIERYQVTHGYFVPTMFVRMLKMPEKERVGADVRSMRMAIHQAAPIDAKTKRKMLDWWGPVLFDSYGASELPDATWITPDEWERKPGSVGRGMECIIRIVDDDGQELPPGEIGKIFFDTPAAALSKYHKDPVRTAEAHSKEGWITAGDLGYLDEEGYLYLTGRTKFKIVTGGINVHPLEVEEVLIPHDAVADVAVFGIPDQDLGERVVAVVQPAKEHSAGDALERDLIDYCRSRIAHFKCPKAIFFEDHLPRSEAGKIYKQDLINKYSVIAGDPS